VAGTTLVKDLTPGAASSTISSMAAFKGLLYFGRTLEESSGNAQLWKSNGTAAGTALVKDLGDYTGRVESLTAFKGLIYYGLNNPSGFSQDTYRTDGTAAGIAYVRSFEYAFGGFQVVGDQLDGMGADEWSGPQHYLSTTGNGDDFHSINDGVNPIEAPISYNSNIYFIRNVFGDSPDSRIYSTVDGKRTTIIGSGLYKDAAGLTAMNNALFFTGCDENACGLWKIALSPPCSASGTILRELWTNVTGGTVATIPVTKTPNSTSQLTSLESPTNSGDYYGQRVRGYICAPSSGSYVF
jgi:ELWxxDGT repeat protein